ncbi:MAG: hypothetical protein HGB15_10060 [Chlorobaculum sp.]|nr:hypothetical protein [Chlorobaculum sp.]
MSLEDELRRRHEIAGSAIFAAFRLYTLSKMCAKAVALLHAFSWLSSRPSRYSFS